MQLVLCSVAITEISEWPCPLTIKLGQLLLKNLPSPMTKLTGSLAHLLMLDVEYFAYIFICRSQDIFTHSFRWKYLWRMSTSKASCNVERIKSSRKSAAISKLLFGKDSELFTYFDMQRKLFTIITKMIRTRRPGKIYLTERSDKV